jgi:hypothetical protein
MSRELRIGGLGTFVTTVSNRIPSLQSGDAEVILWSTQLSSEIGQRRFHFWYNAVLDCGGRRVTVVPQT